MKFSIRAILLLTAFVALLVAALVVFPPTVATVVLMLVNPMIGAGCLAGAIYGRKRLRAFCIGAAPVATLMTALFIWIILIFGIDDSVNSPTAWLEYLEESAPYFKVHTIGCVGITLVSGLTSAVVSWLLQPR